MDTKTFLNKLGLKLRNKGLMFGKGNAKLDERIATFSLPSGFSCPGASSCLSFANRMTGKIKDGKNTEFRCFSASQECLFPNVRKSRWNNFEALRGLSKEQMTRLINGSLPSEGVIRVHVGGDFFSQDYFDAWMEVARLNPSKLFYAYTKSIPFWIARLHAIPDNFKLNASEGGRYDSLIETYGLKAAKVVFTVKQAKQNGLPIDKDDFRAMAGDKSFALLLHGTQPQGTQAGKALSALRAMGIGGYGKGNK